MHTTGIIHHFDHPDMYTNTSLTYIYIYTFSLLWFPLLIPSSTYLAPSRCDRNCPPQFQVACKLIPFVPHCSLVPSPPKSQPFLDFPEPNVYLIRAHQKPPSQHTTQLEPGWSGWSQKRLESSQDIVDPERLKPWPSG
jgi:hypothetical protein